MSIEIRRETPSDVAAIEQLTAAAFMHAPHASHTEQFIVNALRLAGMLAVSLVADDGGKVVGHVALSPVSITDGSEGWYGLGPISVAPECQQQGIGSRLMERALAALRRLDAGGCVVLGEPGYYGRFGFRVEPCLVLPAVPSEYFLCIALRGSIPRGSVTYAEAFAATG